MQASEVMTPMYQGLVRVLLVLSLGATAVIGLGLLVGAILERPPGPGIAIITFVGTFYAAPILALGSLLLAALALAGRGRLSAVERVAAFVVAACGMLPLAVPIICSSTQTRVAEVRFFKRRA